MLVDRASLPGNRQETGRTLDDKAAAHGIIRRLPQPSMHDINELLVQLTPISSNGTAEKAA
jgi:hypothetical protein